MVFFFFFAVAPPGLFRPDVVPQTFFVIVCVGRRDLSAGPKQKKHTTQGVFFFLLRPRRKAREGEAPLGAGTGPEQKKTPPRLCFFAPTPGKGRGRRRPVGRRHGARAKKKKTPPLPFPGAGAKKNALGGVFFCSGPVPAPNGDSPSLAFRRGRSKKKQKHPGWCFFFCSGPVPARGFSFPCLSPGPEQGP